MAYFQLVCVGRVADVPEYQKPQNGKNHWRFPMVMNLYSPNKKKYARWITVYEYGNPEYSVSRNIQKGELVTVIGEPWSKPYQSKVKNKWLAQLCITSNCMVRGAVRNTDEGEGDNIKTFVPEPGEPAKPENQESQELPPEPNEPENPEPLPF